eukprot:CAMPEP_0194091310 /NCGR_PEP_ID=MMETSP0149-20130528/42529_1 /TAXON_ID=122233 /ORGANISM="Chaetoceros debilis, Strain MM31A-1" /LENGTH=761 /DNA_ID=CAMNT_0038775851 /DNA_START=90 /DNA_END=2375 /DNA_ORIENTATION=+
MDNTLEEKPSSPSSATMNENTKRRVFGEGKICHLRWQNITKTVELKDNSTGLLKGTLGGDATVPSDVDVMQPSSNQKIILNQVSGQAKPGEILALMGPSGSGKTSLLDSLASRSTYQDGSVMLNNDVITNDSTKLKKLKRRVAYIKQQDLFFDHLSVKDQLTYTAFLRLSDDMYTKEEKKQEVDKVIALLRLEKCKDTAIRLVSGGERKRVNIGTELLTNPSIIMLDEPTSGLDSTSAVALVNLLVSLAHDHGKTVITSIHQPSSAVYHKFDNVLFLADGCVVYYGKPADSLEYCKKLGYTCPDGYNASDHWMDLLVEDSAISNDIGAVDKDLIFELEGESLIQKKDFSFPIQRTGDADVEVGMKEAKHPSKDMPLSGRTSSSKTKEKGVKYLFQRVSAISKFQSTTTQLHLLDETRIKREEYQVKTTPKARLISFWDVDCFADEMGVAVDDYSSQHSSVGTNTEEEGEGGNGYTERKFATSWGTQFFVLFHRALKNSQSAIFTPVNIVKSIALGILTGLLWFQLPNDETHVRDRGSFLFFSTTYWIFDGTFSAIFNFPSERTIMFKERASGSYHMSAYFMARTLSQLPTALVLPSGFWTIAYWMSGINPRVDVFFGTLGCTLLAVLSGESFGLFVGALVLDFEKATAVMIVISLTTMAAGGYYVQNIPSWIVWIKYTSPFKFGYEASQILVFDRDVKCDGSGDLAAFCKDGAKFASSAQVLETLGSEGTVAGNVGVLIALIFIPRYFAFLALKSKKAAER